jgi:hypothetical protein
MFVEDLAVLSWQMAVVRVADSKRRYPNKRIFTPNKGGSVKGSESI